MTNIKMGLTIEEAAEMSGIGRNTMRKLVDWGKLPVLKVGRKTIIRRDAVFLAVGGDGHAGLVIDHAVDLVVAAQFLVHAGSKA